MIPITPIGTLTLDISSSLGRVTSSITSPIGSFKPAICSRPKAILSILSFVRRRRSSITSLITPRAGYVLDLDGQQENVIDFGTATLIGFDLNENGCAFLLDTDSVHTQSRLLFCDKRGGVLCDRSFDSNLTDVALAGKRVYLLGAEALLQVSPEKEQPDVLAVTAGAEGILLTKEGQLRLVYAGAAEYVEFD